MKDNGNGEVEILVEDTCKYFDKFCCLRDINLKIYNGEFHTLLGPSGCGKTTLLRMVGGLDLPTSGIILHNGDEITGPSPKRGFIFQEGAGFPWRTIKNNIEFGLEIKKMPKDERSKLATKYINLVGLNGFESHYPHQISGGMRQKMALATCLANNPDVLLMDEPFGALDAQTRTYMQMELLRIWKETKKTIIFVTHSIREALLLSDRVSVLKIKPGQIMETYDLDKELGGPNERDSKDPAMMDLETEIYKKLRSFSVHDY
jgi:NitT/TauT family transport system ATP-binding protein